MNNRAITNISTTLSNNITNNIINEDTVETIRHENDDQHKQNDTELSFQNYNLQDIIKLFKISKNISEDDVVKAKETLLKLNTSKVDADIYSLFNKCYSILLSTQKYRDYIKLTKPDYVYTDTDDNEFVRDVKVIPGFEKYNNVLDIVHNIVKDKGLTVENNHPIVPSNPQQIVNTFENKVVSGDVNAIKRNIQLQNVHINSCFRENYYNTNPCNYKYNIPDGRLVNITSMKLASIEVPNAWYLFSHLKGNNKFRIEVTICDKCSVYYIVVPDGNYDKDTLTEYLNKRYFHAAEHTEKNGPLKHLKFSIDPLTNKSQFEIMECTPETFVFSLHFTDKDTENMNETLGWILGFRLARYLKIDDTIISEGLFDGGGDRYVYLAVNDYQYNYNETNIVCFDKMSINDYILAKIPLRNGKLSLIIDENDCNPLIKIRRYNGPVNISRMEIKLLDKFGDVINLNFMDWSFSLELEVLYENALKM